MSAQAEIRQTLEDGDFSRLRQLHAVALPHIPNSDDDNAAEISLHMARTQAGWMTFRKRAYSHAWLTERGLPSQLPDELKPRADRLYPTVTEAVFVSANTNSSLLKPIAKKLQRSMCDVVEDCFANGDRDPEVVSGRMQEARRDTMRRLIGVLA